MPRYFYPVKFFDRGNLIEERTTKYRETGKFPRVKPYKEHVHTGWKYEGKDYEIWVGDSFYFVNPDEFDKCYEDPYDMHAVKWMEGARFDAKWEDLNDYLFVNDDGVLMKKNDGLKDLTIRKLSVPETLGGKMVRAIGYETFCGCNHLKTISLPNTVKNIEKRAFVDCGSLTSVKLGKALTEIGDEAFAGSHISSIEFPEGLETIGAYAFPFCTFNKLLLPDSVSSIGEGAFYNSSLKNIKLSERLSVIKAQTFENSHLDSITIPDSVTVIGEGAFRHSSLKKIDGAKNVKEIGFEAFCLVHLDGFFIPESTVTIGEKSYNYGPDATSVFIPPSVERIGNNAFGNRIKIIEVSSENKFFSSKDGILFDKEGKTLVKYPPARLSISYTIPDGVTAIGDHAFEECTHLRSIAIPETVTSIGDFAFLNCSDLKGLDLPSSLEHLGDGAVGNISAKLTIDEGNSNFKIVDDVLLDKDEKTLFLYSAIKNDKSFVIPTTVTTIGSLAFYESKLENIIIPDSVTHIGEKAFYGCSELKSIVIPDCVTEIKAETFRECYRLEKVVLSKGLKRIGWGAFYECRALSECTLPSLLSEIDDFAFWQCKNLKSVIIPDLVEIIEGCTFCGCKSIETLKLGSSLSEIKDRAFADCYALKEINIPDSLVYIGEGCFSSTLFKDYLSTDFKKKYKGKGYKGYYYIRKRDI